LFSLLSTLSFIRIYLKQLNDQIKLVNPSYRLSKAQAIWLGFVLSAILVTNSLCWAVHSRTSHGKHKESKLRWFFKKAKLPWDKLLVFSIRVILKKYGITEGVLVLDDSNISRSKNTKKLYGLQKLKDKATGGYMKGQSLMQLLLVTDKVTKYLLGLNFISLTLFGWSGKKKTDVCENSVFQNLSAQKNYKKEKLIQASLLLP